MEAFHNKAIYIAGGAGAVGYGIACSLLEKGAFVFISSRDETKLQALPDHDRLFKICADVGSVKGAKEVVAAIGKVPDGVIASLGAYEQLGDLTELSLHRLKQSFANNVLPHFVVAKTFIPLMRDKEGANYIFIGGGGAEIPLVKAGQVSIMDAGIVMMKEVLHEENAHRPLRINMVMITDTVNTRFVENPHPSWITAQQVGDYVAHVLEQKTYRGATLHLYPN